MNREVLIINNIELQYEKYRKPDFPSVRYDVFLSNRYLFTYYTIETTSMKSCENLVKYLKNLCSEEELLYRLNIDNDLPKALRKSIEYCIRELKMNEVTAKLLLDYDFYENRIVNMFQEASNILKKSIDEVFINTDYYYKDQKANRLNNAFAEVRAVIKLNTIGFDQIELLSSKKKLKSVDLIAYLKDEKYVIDVAHFTDSFDKDYEIKFTNISRFQYYIENKYKDKKEQLLSSMKNEKSDRQALFIFIDELNGLYALSTDSEIKEYLQLVHSQLDFKDECGLIMSFKESIVLFL